MISVNATLQDILDAEAKKVSWLATTYEGSIERNWSTKNYTYDGTDYYNRINPESFGPLEFNSSLSHYGIMAPNRFKFKVTDEDEEFDESEFEDQTLTLTLVLSDWSDEEEVVSWLFYVKKARRNNGIIEFECKDFFSKYLEGDYPNTELLSSLSPDDTALPNDNICVPLIFGTAYIPTRSLYITDARYYLLGPNSPTYTISEFRTPSDWDSVSIWDNTYTYTQATKSLNGTDYKVVSPIIVDSDNDGTPDATGLFFKNSKFYDGNIKVSRDDTVSLTSPEDIIEYILEDMGVPSEYIDTESGGTFASAGSTYSGWSLTFNGGFFYKMSRMEALATILRMCNSCLRFTDKIELHVLSKTSQKTITDASIEKRGEKGEPIFTYLNTVPDTSDGAYIAIPESGKPQSLLKQIPIADKSGVCSERSREVIQLPFIVDTQDGQRAGILYRQRKNSPTSLQKGACRDDCVVIQPDDIITINDTKFGGNYTAIVQQVSISLDLTVTLKIGRTGYSLDDWDDLSPDAVTIASDDSGTYWSPILQGPDDDNDNLNRMTSRAWIGTSILLDGVNGAISINDTTFGDQGIQLEYNSGTPRSYTGDGSTKYFKFDGTDIFVYADGLIIDSSIPALLMGSATDYLTGEGIFEGKSGGLWKLHIGDPANDYLSYDGAGNLHITGEFSGSTSLDGTMANTFTINSDLDDVSAQLILGRTTGGNLTLQWDGTDATLSNQTIADNAILTVDHASVTDNDYAKFTANGLEGRSYAEVLSDLSGEATGAFDFNSQIVYSGNFYPAYQTGSGNAAIELGSGRTDSGYAFIDLVGDTTYTDYGLRIIRYNTGANAETRLEHRGTGDFNLWTTEAADFKIYTNSTLSLTIDSSQNITLAAGANLDVDNIVSSTNLTISPTGDLIFDPTGDDIYPGAQDINLGILTSKWLTIHGRELWVSNLVADNILSTIGGHLLVASTTTYDEAIGSGDGSFDVKDASSYAVNDWTMSYSNSNFEVMQITGIASNTLTVDRNEDGSGANAWNDGDAIVNLGYAVNEGWIEQYALSSVSKGSTVGPTIVGFVRTGTTNWDDYVEGWAIGNLNGLYGYGANIMAVGLGPYSEGDYLTIDPTNGIRFFDSGDVVRGQLSSGEWTLGYTTNEHVKITNTAVQIKDGATVYTDLTAGVLTLGDSSNEHSIIDSSGMTIKDGATFLARFGSTVYLGDWDTGDEFIQIDSNGVEITSGGVKVIDIDGSGVPSIAISVGGDITLAGDNSNPGTIFFEGSSYVWEEYVNGNGQTLNITPTSAFAAQLQIGTSSYRVNIDTFINSTFTMQFAGGLGFFYEDDIFRSYTDGGADVGSAITAFGDGYATGSWHDSADFYFLDDRNDLAVLQNIKGSGIIDEITGLEIIDDNSLADWLFTRHKKDRFRDSQGSYFKGDIARNSEGKPYISHKMWSSLLSGAIRQENRERKNDNLKLKELIDILQNEVDYLRSRID